MPRRITVIASMRNEGPFILEWLAWYRMLGFTDAVIVTNHCTDHSPRLLDQLALALPWVHHIAYDPAPTESIALSKIAKAREHEAVQTADWVLVCDVDEFLVIHKDDGRIEALIGPEDTVPNWTAMAINWQVFGTCGVERFVDEPVHHQFLYGLPRKSSLNGWVKTLFRTPNLFRRFSDHGPAGFSADLAGVEWGTQPFVFVNSAFQPIAGWDSAKRVNRYLEAEEVTHEAAQINHYMLRSAETWSLKAGTKSAVAGHDRYTSGYFRQANKAVRLDPSAFRYAEAFDAEFTALMQLPGIARLHALCCAQHLQAIFDKQGKDVSEDPRYQAFLARALDT